MATISAMPLPQPCRPTAAPHPGTSCPRGPRSRPIEPADQTKAPAQQQWSQTTHPRCRRQSYARHRSWRPPGPTRPTLPAPPWPHAWLPCWSCDPTLLAHSRTPQPPPPTRHRHHTPPTSHTRHTTARPPALTRNEGVALWYERVIDHVVV